jgi:hypothetical protein
MIVDCSGNNNHLGTQKLFGGVDGSNCQSMREDYIYIYKKKKKKKKKKGAKLSL